ncbi:Small-conductance mechanosensitive channel [Actinopolymorpha cephalotaxi]|uniref:Small-conductance mechanosensitive channel n=1 Tax=Actinopolymorpha cephalotaxi TaxID=504797 RepID=A0A1I2XEL0_9ACTN|nr:mechanosensitive ion channel domain-containing protein [Actinopolymorpha cephalotaxi]NYH86219.1 small-conductance mechanosensitive channel [Actinopolymorpha cephalotaxi]SFH11923.1 Small-conductance mechanosensitive channel [Actinopolymorpha cephalotaxi]
MQVVTAVSTAVPDPMHTLLVLGCTAAAALVVTLLTGRITARLARSESRPFWGRLRKRCHRPWTVTLLSVALLAAQPSAGLHGELANGVRHLLVVLTIAAVSWLVTAVLFLAEDAALRHIRVDVTDNRRARKVQTQLTALRRLTAVLVTLVAASAIFMTFDALRTYGASILASAGVAGVIAGLAAQTTLANVFAGLQLVFTDALRIDDVVVVEEEWGRVEELTLTYVVVNLWDERRLVLPATYFTTTPFQNWTRSESRVIGAVVLYLDHSTPVSELRAEARRIIEKNPLWDRREWTLQVVDTTEHSIVVRVLASAADSASAWDLRCDVREHLLGWLRDNHPGSLPRLRTERAGGPGGPGDSGGPGGLGDSGQIVVGEDLFDHAQVARR